MTDSATFFTRTGNHSTTHSRRGDSSHMYGEFDISDQLQAVAEQMIKGRAFAQTRDHYKAEKQRIIGEIRGLNVKLKETHPWAKFLKLTKQRAQKVKELGDVDAEI